MLFIDSFLHALFRVLLQDLLHEVSCFFYVRDFKLINDASRLANQIECETSASKAASPAHSVHKLLFRKWGVDVDDNPDIRQIYSTGYQVCSNYAAEFEDTHLFEGCDAIFLGLLCVKKDRTDPITS